MKIFIYAAMLLVSTTVMADDDNGLYDGIWSSPAGYFSVHENGGTLVAVRLADDRSEWEALAGERKGDTVRLETIISGVSAVIDVTLTSETTLIATQVSCVPVEAGEFCSFPDGTSFPAEKIW